MNRDDIIRMAQECGLTINGNVMLGVEHFANLVAVAEREACARVCENRANGYQHETDVYAHEHINEANYCAAAIRARGEE